MIDKLKIFVNLILNDILGIGLNDKSIEIIALVIPLAVLLGIIGLLLYIEQNRIVYEENKEIAKSNIEHTIKNRKLKSLSDCTEDEKEIYNKVSKVNSYKKKYIWDKDKCQFIAKEDTEK